MLDRIDWKEYSREENFLRFIDNSTEPIVILKMLDPRDCEFHYFFVIGKIDFWAVEDKDFDDYVRSSGGYCDYEVIYVDDLTGDYQRYAEQLCEIPRDPNKHFDALDWKQNELAIDMIMSLMYYGKAIRRNQEAE